MRSLMRLALALAALVCSDPSSAQAADVPCATCDVRPASYASPVMVTGGDGCASKRAAATRGVRAFHLFPRRCR